MTYKKLIECQCDLNDNERITFSKPTKSDEEIELEFMNCEGHVQGLAAVRFPRTHINSEAHTYELKSPDHLA